MTTKKPALNASKPMLLVYHDGDIEKKRWLEKAFREAADDYVEIHENVATIKETIWIASFDSDEHNDPPYTLDGEKVRRPVLYAVFPNLTSATKCQDNLDKAIKTQEVDSSYETKLTFLEP